MMHEAVIPAQTSRPAQHAMIGSHVVLDLYDCETEHLDDLAWIKRTMTNAARAARATIVETVFHRFAPWGISGVVIIAESHLAIHAWPENRFVAIDVFTCGDSVMVDVASAFLTREFRSRRPMRRCFGRGDQSWVTPVSAWSGAAVDAGGKGTSPVT